MIPAYVIYSMGVVKIIKGGKHIVSDGLSWVTTEFFVCGRVTIRHITLPLSNDLMTRFGFEPNFVRWIFVVRRDWVL